jgi:AcrR family transcriptional regulator
MRVPATERRQQLIEAAVQLMARDGVDGANLRAIAKEAGAPLASVHYCFTDKDELMREAVEHWLRSMVGSMAEEVPDQAGLRSAMKRIADDYWQALEDDPLNVLAQLELILWAMRGSDHEALARSIYARYEEVLGEIFTRALNSAGEQSSVQVGQLARAFVGIIDAASLQFLADPKSPKPHDLYYLLIDALLSAAGV